jgi:pimeloyl-ACP methyl ester carboxylesterase
VAEVTEQSGAEVTEHSGEIEESPVFWRTATAPAGAATAPTLYLHGVPTNSDDWVPFLRRGGGLAPDLPGFGRSGKAGNLEYTIEGYERFIERFLNLVGVERVRLLMHDWGSVGLAFAQRHRERVERLVVMDAIPFLPGYRWHRIARVWRTPLLGELAMGSMTRRVLRVMSRESNATPGPMPDSFLDSVVDHFDHGTQRAILRLYRSAPSEVLAAAGEHLSELSMPALVVWGEHDPYVPHRFADEYARVLPNATLLKLPDAGHWPWIDRPDVVDTVVAFLAAP